MSSQPSPLNDLLPEIYPIIAAYLPLYSTPSTLLSLALVNHHISEIVLPLVYVRLILKNENDLKVIQRLLDEPELGQVVREIHVLADRSWPTRGGAKSINVFTGLEKLITAASLPFIHTLGLQTLSGWCYNVGFGRLRSDFWIDLKKNCPRLRGLVLRGIMGHQVNDSGLLEIQDITSFTLNFEDYTLRAQAGSEKLLKSIDRLSANLHTLNLAPNYEEWTSASPLLAMNFPKLRSLSLASFIIDRPAQAMAFWERHPSLEFLKIVSRDAYDSIPWFSRDSVFPPRFLPNLKHLKSHFLDVRNVAPILNQLVSLTVYGSINAQIPYLLRSVLPDGLPNLKSLNIGQMPTCRGAEFEGGLWYETEDGKFCQAKATKLEPGRVFVDGYIHSIARGAPNLEEIGFHSYTIELEEFAKIASGIAGLSKLRRFYHEGPDELKDEQREAIISNTRTLAEACKELTMIINTGSINLPYVVASISRTENGEVRSVDFGSGCGMQIGSEDEAFPM